MTDRTYTRHRLSALCGDMDPHSFKALVRDIREQGQLEPIDLLGDKIVDGWHRYRACQKLGLEPKTRALPEEVEPVAYVLGKNAHRRHMKGEQRAAVVLLAADWMPAHRPAAKGKGDPVSLLSNDEAAARAGVSKRTIQRVKAAIRAGHGTALATGTETLRSLAAKARKAALEERRKDPNKAKGDGPKKRPTVVELQIEVGYLKTVIDTKESRIAQLTLELERLEAKVERLTLERDEVTGGGGWG